MAEFADRYDIGSLELTERRFSDFDLVKRLIRVYMFRHKLLVFLMGLLIAGRMATTLIGLYIYKVVIDFFVRKTSTTKGRWLADLIQSTAMILSGSDTPNMGMVLTVAGIFYVLVALALWVVASLQSYYIDKLGQTIIADIRSDFFRHLEDLSQRFFEHGNTGRLVSRVTNDA